MRKLLAAMAVLSSASMASANLIIYDGFNYDATGTPAPVLGTPSTAAGAFGTWTSQGNATVEPRIASGSLSYTGLPASVGNSARLDNNNGAATGADASRLYIGTITSGTVYYSFILNLPTATSTGGTGGAFFAGFDSATNGSAYATFGGLFVRTDGTDTTKVDLGASVSNPNTLGNKVFSTTAYSTNTSLFVVGSFTFGGASNLDVFVDPTAIPTSEPGTHSATTTGTDTTAASITNFYLRGNSGEPQGITVDELRIGTSWADVTPAAGSPVPEPASAALVLVPGAIGLISRRRARA